MAVNLFDYAHLEFPGRDVVPIDDRGGDLTLTSHTLVVHVVGSADAEDVAEIARREAGATRVGGVVVRSLPAALMPDDREDREGAADLPGSRLIASGWVGAAFGLAAGVLAGWVTSDHVLAAVVLGGFGAVVGAVLGVMFGGGARYAGQRAVSQPAAAGQDIAIVAAFLDDESDASGLARAVAGRQQFDVRVVGVDGRWHAPSA